MKNGKRECDSGWNSMELPESFPEFIRIRILFFDAHWSQEFHAATTHELLHVLDGKMTLQQQDGYIFNGSVGDTLVIPREMRHRDVFNLTTDLKLLFITFAWPEADRLIAALNNFRIGRIRDSARSELRWIFERIRNDHAGLPPNPMLEKVRLMNALLLLFRENGCAESVPESITSHAALAEAARRFMERNYHQSITLELIARHLQVSRAHLSRVFREECNFPLFEYLLECRLMEAKKLLRDGNMPVKEVASRIGFANGGYFSKVFRRKLGCSPADFRRRKQ